MTTRVEKSIMVNVPVSTAYNQWTQFEDFPQFMGGVQRVTQLSDDRLEWVAQIAGVRRKWEAKILEQVPDQKVAWAATEGATNAGAVTFEDVGGGQTSVRLFLEYEPEGLVEAVGDRLNIVEKQAESDLDRFKAFIESEGYATGAWRGSVAESGHVGTPGVEHADASRGDEGKAGLSGKAVAAGLGLAAVAAASVVASRSTDTAENDEPVLVEPVPAEVEVVASTPVAPAPVAPAPTRAPLDAPLDAPLGGGLAPTTGDGLDGPRMLTSDEIDAGASDEPLPAADPDDTDPGSARLRP